METTNDDRELGMPVIGTKWFLSENDENVKQVRNRFGKTHKIEAVKGTKVSLAKLDSDQSVCYGDGESYHFRLTPLENKINY